MPRRGYGPDPAKGMVGDGGRCRRPPLALSAVRYSEVGAGTASGSADVHSGQRVARTSIVV